MAREDPAEVVTIGSDHDHGNGMLIEFYAGYLSTPRQVVYQDLDRWSDPPPRWLIIHRYRRWRDRPPEKAYDIEGATYLFERSFDCAMLSGWRWLCYRRQP